MAKIIKKSGGKKISENICLGCRKPGSCVGCSKNNQLSVSVKSTKKEDLGRLLKWVAEANEVFRKAGSSMRYYFNPLFSASQSGG